MSHTFVYFVMTSSDDKNYSFTIVCPICRNTIGYNGTDDCNFSLGNYPSGTPFIYTNAKCCCEHVYGIPFSKELFCAPLNEIHYGYNLENSIETIKKEHSCFVEISPEVLETHSTFKTRVFKVGVLEVLSVGSTDQGIDQSTNVEDIIDPNIIKYHTHKRFDHYETLYMINIDRYNELNLNIDFDAYDIGASYFEARCKSCGKEHLSNTTDD